MKAHGYLVETFDSAASFLGSEHLTTTDCLIADVQMPGMTGLELHDRLVATGRPIPTILITGHPDEGVRSRALQAGVFRYLTKPIDGADFLEVVRSALGRAKGAGDEDDHR